MDQDQKILKNLDDNFSCKICDEVLISAKTCNCGHSFCTYCLDLLQTMTKVCPECIVPITSTAKSPQIDTDIDNQFLSCSLEVRKSRELAKEARIQTSEERTKKFKEIKTNLPHSSGIARSGKTLDEICTSLASNIAKSSSESRTPASNRQIKKPQSVGITDPQGPKINANTNTTTDPEANNPNPDSEIQCSQTGLEGMELMEVTGTDEEGSGIDTSKIEALFDMYNVFLKSEPDEGGCGDAIAKFPDRNDSGNAEGPPESAEIQRLRQKHKKELETLLREAENAIELDAFVKKWSQELGYMANESDKPEVKSSREISQIEGAQGLVLPEIDEKQVWKASVELIKQYRDVKNQTRRTPIKDVIDKDQPLVFDEVGDVITSHRCKTPLQTDYDLELNELTQSSSSKLNKNSKGDSVPKSVRQSVEDSPEPGNPGPRGTHLSAMGENIADDNLSFWRNVADCKNALTHLQGRRAPLPTRDLPPTGTRLPVLEKLTPSIPKPRINKPLKSSISKSVQNTVTKRPQAGPKPSTPTPTPKPTKSSIVPSQRTSRPPRSETLMKKPQFK